MLFLRRLFATLFLLLISISPISAEIDVAPTWTQWGVKPNVSYDEVLWQRIYDEQEIADMVCEEHIPSDGRYTLESAETRRSNRRGGRSYSYKSVRCNWDLCPNGPYFWGAGITDYDAQGLCDRIAAWYLPGTYGEVSLAGEHSYECKLFTPDETRVRYIGYWTIYERCAEEDIRPSDITSIMRELVCEPGYWLNFDGSNVVCTSGELEQSRMLGPMCETKNDTNPINSATGNKYQYEADYMGKGTLPLRLERQYNSKDSLSSKSFKPKLSGFSNGGVRYITLDFATGDNRRVSIGNRWRHSYDYGLRIMNNVAGVRVVRVYRPDGKSFLFQNFNNKWLGDAGVTTQLTELTNDDGETTGWEHHGGANVTELYDHKGNIKQLSHPTGTVQTVTYDSHGRLNVVRDSFGHELTFGYNSSSSNRIATVTDPDNEVYSYEYGSNGNLISVTYPDHTRRIYLYEDERYPYSLTAIVDENNNRFAQWSYDDTGRAVSSEHANGVNKIDVFYNSDSTTTMLNPIKGSQTYTFTRVARVKKIQGVDGGPCKKCGNQASGYDYDDNGYLTSKTDWNGVTTIYQRDVQGREISRTEASGTPQARTITTQWHDTYDVPVMVVEPGQTIHYRYDTQGRRISRTTETTQ